MSLARAAGKAMQSGRVRSLRLLWGVSKTWSIMVSLLALANAVLPNVSLIAMGWAVSRIPAAARSGLHGAPARQLYVALAVSGVLYALNLLTGPYQEMLSSSVKALLTDRLQHRLMTAVSGPVGIGHLEDPEVLDQLAMAQGQLAGMLPADAPVALAGGVGTRLSGVLACAALASFQWWLGLGIFVMWTLVRRPMRQIVLAQVVAFRAKSQVLRRAWYYLLDGSFSPVAAKEVRVFGLEGWLVDQYRDQWAIGIAESETTLRKLNGRVWRLSGVVLVTYLIACGVLAHASLDHQISLGRLAVMLPMLPMTMYAGSITLADISTEWMVAGLPDLQKLERRLLAPELPGRGPAAGLPARSLRFEGTSFRYPGAERPVLDRIELEIPAGTSMAIVGQNGAGKTTLVKLLARMHDPTDGRITVDGISLADLDAAAWQRQVAAVFQDFNKYPLSLRENITLGAFAHADDEAGLLRAARRAGCLDVAEQVGWDTVLSRAYTGGTDLSGGQWQRVALARALFAVEHGAKVLILDEPTSWLDVRAEAEFFERFWEITKGTTSIVISHRFSTVRRAQRICVLANGKLAEQGSHDELLALGGQYAEMFRLQAARFTSAVPAGPEAA